MLGLLKLIENIWTQLKALPELNRAKSVQKNLRLRFVLIKQFFLNIIVLHFFRFLK